MNRTRPQGVIRDFTDPGDEIIFSEEEYRQGVERTRQDYPLLSLPDTHEAVTSHKDIYTNVFSPLEYDSYRKLKLQETMSQAGEKSSLEGVSSLKIDNENLVKYLEEGILKKLVGKTIQLSVGGPRIPRFVSAKFEKFNSVNQRIYLTEYLKSKVRFKDYSASYYDFFYQKHLDKEGRYISDASRAIEEYKIVLLRGLPTPLQWGEWEKSQTEIAQPTPVTEEVPSLTLEQASKDRIKKLQELITPIDWKSESKDISNKPPIPVTEEVPSLTLEQASKDRLKKLKELITPATSIDWESESKDISNEPPPSWSSWLTGKK